MKMKRLLLSIAAIVLTVFPALAVQNIYMPPEEYRHEPKQKYIITFVGPDVINNYCMVAKKYLVLGCVNAINGDRMYIVNNLTKEETEQTIIHEKAHLNGWIHPDARKAYSK